MNRIRLRIGEMNCVKCANRLQGILEGATGIKKAEVSFERQDATISFRPHSISPPEILALVEKAGFTAEET